MGNVSICTTTKLFKSIFDDTVPRRKFGDQEFKRRRNPNERRIRDVELREGKRLQVMKGFLLIRARKSERFQGTKQN